MEILGVQMTAELFDQVIFFFIGSGLFLLTIFSKMSSRTGRRKDLRILSFLTRITLLGLAIIIYGSFIEPRMITTTHQYMDYCQVREECSGESILVALVADFHVGPYKQEKYVARIVEKLNLMIPDFVIIPGDVVYGNAAEAKHLAQLQNIVAPVYATLGNHDYTPYEQGVRGVEVKAQGRSDTITQSLTNFDVRVLRDEALIDAETGVAIVGQEDWWKRPFSPIENITIPESSFTIMMQHNPDGALMQELPNAIDLVVSGHTHGGQIRLPLIGPIAPIPTESGRGYDQGLFRIDDDTRLYITRGIGESGPRARLLAWPEIVLLDIHY